MPKIRFQAKLTAIGSQTILRLPEAASSKLPSRGMSVVEGTFNGHAFQAPLEPDGIGSHDDRAATGNERENFLHGEQRALDVDTEDPVNVRFGDGAERQEFSRACVGDQYVQPAVAFLD